MVELGGRGAAADRGRDGGGEEGCKWRAGPGAECPGRARSGEWGLCAGGGAEALWERAGGRGAGPVRRGGGGFRARLCPRGPPGVRLIMTRERLPLGPVLAPSPGCALCCRPPPALRGPAFQDRAARARFARCLCPQEAAGGMSNMVPKAWLKMCVLLLVPVKFFLRNRGYLL